MGRIIALDYGLKRTGVAATDPLKIIASPLETIPTQNLVEFLTKYCDDEQVETIVVGMPKTLDDKDTHSTSAVRKLIDKLKEKFPTVNIEEEDERYTSKMAMEALVMGGMKKKNRRKKENIDKVSAALILQSYLQSHGSL